MRINHRPLVLIALWELYAWGIGYDQNEGAHQYPFRHGTELGKVVTNDIPDIVGFADVFGGTSDEVLPSPVLLDEV